MANKMNIVGILFLALVCLIHHSYAQTNPDQCKLTQLNLFSQRFQTHQHIPSFHIPTDTVQILEDFRDAMLARPAQVNWTKALASWTCPTNPSNSVGDCDPCGGGAWGNWDHVGCRGPAMGVDIYSLPGTGDVTDIHITDYRIEGAVPVAELCPLVHLRQIDLDGGHLTGSIPTGFADCFPNLLELDLSYNQLTGTIPGAAIADVKSLHQFKVDHNQLTGSIPAELMSLPEIHWFRFSANNLEGPLPATLSQTARILSLLALHTNDIEGDLKPLANHRLTSFEARENPKLCGLVPVGVRFASGFNYYGTKLGVPCSLVA